jgi:hypothetical protein
MLAMVAVISAGCGGSRSSGATSTASNTGTAISTGSNTGSNKALQPPGSFSAKMSSAQMSAARKFAQCMRENGVKDFPDPVNGERLVDTTRIPSSGTPGGMSILRAAMQKCAVTSWERQWGG